MALQWTLARPSLKRNSISRGFTLIELLVSITILLIIMAMVFSILDSTSLIWRKSTSKIQTFQESRAAFESVTRKLSQATLNTYWDYDYDSNGNPTKYKRQSELHFVSGQVNTLLGTSTIRFTHAIFFQAPLSYVSGTANRPLNKLLNAVGFYIEYGDDSSDRPSFLPTAVIPVRKRFRLREMWQPAENLSLYSLTSPPNGSSSGTSSYPTGSQTGYEWFAPALTSGSSQSRVLAENIITLVFLPRLPEREDYAGTAIAPNYSYSSRRASGSTVDVTYQGVDINGANTVSGIVTNQLPPQVQVMMVALDETSAARLESLENDSSKTLQTILTKSGTTMLFTNSVDLAADTALVQQRLADRKLTYQIFNATVTIEGAKWSNN